MVLAFARQVMFGILFTVLTVDAAPGASVPAATPGFDLARLTQLEDRKTTPIEKAKLGLRFYRDEMLSRTPAPPPPFTDFKTHDYVLARITRKLIETGADTATLRDHWTKANPGEVRDCLMLFLFFRAGKNHRDGTELRGPVIAFLRNRAHPMRLRELAAEGLGNHAVQNDDLEVGDVLAAVAREDVQSGYRSEKGKDGKPARMYLVYPVKRAAVDAIKKMDAAGMLLESPVTSVIKQVPVEILIPAPPAR